MINYTLHYFLTKCDGYYYKVYKRDSKCYEFFKCYIDFITNCECYFKMKRFLQNVSVHGLITNISLINVMVNILLRKIHSRDLNKAISLVKTSITLKVTSISANKIASLKFQRKTRQSSFRISLLVRVIQNDNTQKLYFAKEN